MPAGSATVVEAGSTTTWPAALRSVQVTVIGRDRVNDSVVASIERVEVLREEQRSGSSSTDAQGADDA